MIAVYYHIPIKPPQIQHSSKPHDNEGSETCGGEIFAVIIFIILVAVTSFVWSKSKVKND